MLGQHFVLLSTIPLAGRTVSANCRHYACGPACQAGRKEQRKKGSPLMVSSLFIWNQNPFQRFPEDFPFPLISSNSSMGTPDAQEAGKSTIWWSRMGGPWLAHINPDILQGGQRNFIPCEQNLLAGKGWSYGYHIGKYATKLNLQNKYQLMVRMKRHRPKNSEGIQEWNWPKICNLLI